MSQSGTAAAVRPGGVDLYVGGTEHAVLHLLYARFWHKVLYDLGHVSTPEPFQRLVNQGLILGEDGQKMSKSRGNVVNPDVVIDAYGADALRCYLMFMGPLEASKPWSMAGVEGIARWLARVWRLIMEENQAGDWVPHPAVQDVEPTRDQLKIVHATIKKVGEDIEELAFNTAISQMMVCTNAFVNAEVRPRACLRLLVQVLAPFAPHIASELWARLALAESGAEGKHPTPNIQHPTSNGSGADPAGSLDVGCSMLDVGCSAAQLPLSDQPWPSYDPALLIEDEVELPVQVNGKLRAKIRVKKDATPAEIEAAARAADGVPAFLEGKEVRKVIVVPGRMVNIVAP